MKCIKEEGLPEVHGRNQLREARNEVAAQETQFGSVITEINVVGPGGAPTLIAALRPAALLWVAILASAGLAALFRITSGRVPVKPRDPVEPCHVQRRGYPWQRPRAEQHA